MGILDFFLRRKGESASVAKDRLQIVLAHERKTRDAPDFVPLMQKELLAVVAKYVPVREDMIKVGLDADGVTSVLEINIEFDRSSAKALPPTPEKPEKPARKVAPKPTGKTAKA